VTLKIGNARQRRVELKCSGGLLDRLCERETRREELDFARHLIRRYGSVDEALRQVELERIRPAGRLEADVAAPGGAEERLRSHR
jgi:hypothetical protein